MTFNDSFTIRGVSLYRLNINGLTPSCQDSWFAETTDTTS